MSAILDPSASEPSNVTLEGVRQQVQELWGYDSLRPLQQEAMESVLSGRDSVVVLPTGGGKSLCFQAPACCLEGVAVVVSPLIALMKDQVDTLCEIGIAAAAYNSTLSGDEKQAVVEDLKAGRLKLLYLAPETLLNENTLSMLQASRVSLIAIDEAHCISSWGHDFRPEYRGLKVLKARFPDVGIHAYTATATERVQQDIADQLQLEAVAFHVGSFDRPNLVYQVERRQSGLDQVLSVLERHKNESGIIYCITRKEVEKTAAALKALGYRVARYHAGLDARQRTVNQEAFLAEEIDVIVATIAFGMGIDKSNIRFVVHTGMPKSVEAYQQESGRAGRDGLEADCSLFYSSSDVLKWKRLLEDSPTGREEALAALDGIDRFCNTPRCRHQLLVEHFGQQLEQSDCQACDVCLSQLELAAEPLVLAQKILSCIARLEQRFGGEYTAQVLVGSSDQRILQNGHDKLSTYGLLEEHSKRVVRDWLEQLVGQKCAERFGEYHQLRLTELGLSVLRGEHTPRLQKPAANQKSAKTKADAASWEGVDRELFEQLRTLRREIAAEKEVPAYIVFGDSTLRDLARRRPSTEEGLLAVSGIGKQKLAEYGARFLSAVGDYCQSESVEMDVQPGQSPPSAPSSARETSLSAAAVSAFPLFRQGLSISEVASQLERAESTVLGYLQQYLRHEAVTDWSPWVEPKTAMRIVEAIAAVGGEKLKPIFEYLDGQVSYDEIRVVATCVANAEV